MDQRLTEPAGGGPVDWRGLCGELVDDLQEARDAVADWAAYASEYFQQKHDLQGELDRINCRLDRTRTLLAQPEPEAVVPTDEELLEAFDGEFAEFFDSSDGFGTTAIPRSEWIKVARAVLARWGHQPAPPVEGEVVEFLRDWGDDYADEGTKWHRAADLLEQQATAYAICERERLHQSTRAADLEIERHPVPVAAGEVRELVAWLRGASWDSKRQTLATRAADLLERQAAPVLEPALARINDILNDSGRVLQTDEREALELARQALDRRQAAPVPVPVAERLPDTSDPAECRMPDGVCWWFDPHADGAWFLDTYQSCYTHWRPFHALPLPSGELQP